MTVRISNCDLAVLGTGLAVPGAPVTTEELVLKLDRMGVKGAKLCGAIAKKLGVNNRYFCRAAESPVETPCAGSTNPELASSALEQALHEAGITANDLQYLLTHTTSPHTSLPPNASWVADRLEYDGPYAEIRQACTGFANAMMLAVGMLNGEDERAIGIVGSETGTVYLDTRLIDEDRDQLVNTAQMGDGAGAIVVARRNGHRGSHIPFVYYGTLGHGKKPGLTLYMGGSSQAHDLTAFRHDFTHVKESGMELIRTGLNVALQAGLELSDIDWIIPHQANGRMDEVLAPELGVPREKIFVCATEYGNTGSASIWMAFHRLRTSGKLKSGSKVLVLGAEATKFMLGGFLYIH
ncbi:MAG: 3-oxoacyl-ACP synthase [Candidatus Hydrogenedentes bacterium]|nr:3-oxoacyl-ACP synthase [Candidatus Hydrogenedentota bacterium]